MLFYIYIVYKQNMVITWILFSTVNSRVFILMNIACYATDGWFLASGVLRVHVTLKFNTYDKLNFQNLLEILIVEISLVYYEYQVF